MDIAIWIAQGLLAVGFGAAGFMKLIRSKDELAANMGWVEDFSTGFVKLVGVVEVLGALGLVLPGITGIAPILTPLAAAGLAVDQLAAAVVHLRRNELQNIVANAVLFALAVFVAWGRFGEYPL